MRIVIDLGALWHAIRRALTRVFPTENPKQCWECRTRLSADERDYYGRLCERCVGVEVASFNDATR